MASTRSMMEPRDSRGAALIDLVVACAVLVVLAAVAIPTLHASRERDTGRMAARHLASKLQLLRVEAVRRNRVVAMRLDPDDLGQYAVYVDGDGDGVRQYDIDTAVDPPIEPPAHLSHVFSTVALRIASSVPAPDGAGMLGSGSDPIRIGNTNLISFSPLGSSTSGTIYLAARDGTQWCVRLLGVTGRVRVMWFDPARRAWRQD